MIKLSDVQLVGIPIWQWSVNDTSVYRRNSVISSRKDEKDIFCDTADMIGIKNRPAGLIAIQIVNGLQSMLTFIIVFVGDRTNFSELTGFSFCFGYFI